MKKVANIVFNSFVNDSRVLKESLSLTRNGYKVEVIAHLDKGLLKEEVKEGLKISRLGYLDRKATKIFLGKLKAYSIFFKEAVKHCKGFDIIHCNDLNTLPIGVVIKKIYSKRVKIVYDAHEYETEVHGLHGMKKKIVKYFEKSLIKHVDKVITVSDTIANEYVKLYDIKKPSLVLNTPPFKQISKKNIFRDFFEISKEQTIFLYQGGLSTGRGIELLLDTFKSLWVEQNIIEKKDYPVIVFMGYGSLQTLIIETSKDYKNIFFHKAVSPDVLLDYTSSADFGISTIQDTCLSYRYCLPNKMFEYLMAELPVIVSNLYEMTRLVETYNVGVVAENNTIEDIKKAIKKTKNISKSQIVNNIRNVKIIYNWEEQEKVLLKVYNTL